MVPQEARGKASTNTSIIQLDYAYIKQSQDKGQTTILTWVESLTGLAGSLITPTKGPTTQQLIAVVTFIKRQGFEQSILQCDEEPAFVKLVEEIGKQTSLSTRQSQAYNQRSEEWQSNLFAQFRALLLDFCSRHKLRPSDVHIGGSFSQHMQTSFPGRWGIAITSVLPFGELVLTSDLSLAICLGRCESSDEHILAKANGNSLVTSTSVTRLSLESSMELASLKSTSIPALEPASVAYLERAKNGTKPIAQAGGDEQLRMENPPQASNHQPQHKLLGSHQQTGAMLLCLSSFHQDWHSHLHPKLPYVTTTKTRCNSQLCTHQLCNNQLHQHQQ